MYYSTIIIVAKQVGWRDGFLAVRTAHVENNAISWKKNSTDGNFYRCFIPRCIPSVTIKVTHAYRKVAIAPSLFGHMIFTN